MTYEITFSKADRWQSLPFVKLLNRMENNGKTLKIEVVIEEEDMENFEAMIDGDPHIKRWHRFGGNGWPEVKSGAGERT